MSDGSYKEDVDVSTAAWVVEFGENKQARGGGVVPSAPGDNNAYRAELGGLLGQLLLIESVEKIVPPSQPYTVRVACDGKSALFRSLLTTRDQFNSRQKGFDIISSIISIRERLCGDVLPVHVYGHQDDTDKELSRLEVLNVEMDALAKAILSDAILMNQNIPDAIPVTTDGIIQVDYKDMPITSNLASTIRYQIGKNRIVKWWRFKQRIKPDVSNEDIDWEVMQRVSEELSFGMRRFVSKWVSHHISVGRMMKFRSERNSSKCPCCGHGEETTIHVLRCPASSCRLRWTKELHTLDKWMRDNRTAPQLQDAIYAVLRRFYHDDYDTYVPHDMIGTVRDCVEAQAKIGWVGFLEGLLTPKWATVQDTYLKHVGLQRTGRRWAVNLSKKLWTVVFAMWDHRNSILFANGKVEELSGMDKLKKAIVREREIGLGEMDESLRPYLTLPQSSISRMKPIDLQRWFFLIRQARKETGYKYDDEFATSKSLCNWVGLP